MKSFQLVRERTAEPILKDGFQESYPDLTEDSLGFECVRSFYSPDGWDPGIKGWNILQALEIPEYALTRHEVVVIEDEPEIQEFLVPTSLVNSYGPPVVEEADINWSGASGRDRHTRHW
jgi:hypothetical protein